MSNLMQLRLAAREILDEVFRAVDPAAAVRTAVQLTPSELLICGKGFDLRPGVSVFAVAIGKAAGPMAVGLESVLGDRLKAGVISAPAVGSNLGRISNRWQRFCGGHPLPDEASLHAAKAAFTLLEQANVEQAFVVFLISGGGSAMLESPVSDDIALGDLRETNRILINSGASIGEVNAVRRALSEVKAGRLADRAPNCRQVTLIVSDVPKGKEHDVASGPTLPSPADASSPAKVVPRYGLRDKLPESIRRAIDNPPPLAASSPNRGAHFVLLDNESALEAVAHAARGRGFATQIAREISDGSVEAGAESLLTRLVEMKQANHDVCLISGGEFSCPVKGDGIGGRNSETALRLAIAAEDHRDRIGSFVALCAGTDGVDGNSPAAGAIVDSTTIERAQKIGLDPNDFLVRSDSYSFFVALGDVITTGPTGTNVRDVRILLASGQNPER